MKSPRTRYAKTADGVNIAYSVTGDGPDLAYLPGAWGDVELWWESPTAGFLSRLAESFRLILHDPRGSGMSDGDRVADLETRASDFLAVADAIGAENVSSLAVTVGGHMPILLGSTAPQRVAALAWYLPYARYTIAKSHPFGLRPERYEHVMADLEETWGDPDHSWRFPGELGLSPTDELRELMGRLERRFCGPGRARENLETLAGTDVRDLLPSFRVPTVLLVPSESTPDILGSANYLQRRIPDASIQTLAGPLGLTMHLAEPIAASIERLLGVRRPVALDRILATVMFTDIVGSTDRAAALGDRAWGEVLERHHNLVRASVARYRGHEIKTLGDGFLATFDGPARAVRCALAITIAVRNLGIDVRIGLHTGEIEIDGDDVRGIAVHIGSRVVARAGPSEVLVSSTVKDLVAGSGLTFEDAGEHELKGVPDRWHLYRVRE